MSQTYYAILTAVGEAKLANATALGIHLELTHMGVGDGNGATPQPNRNQTALVHENRRAQLNRLFVDPANASQIVAEQIIPEDIGGWWVREIGLYDKDGNLCAVANCPDTYKPLLASGSGRTQIIRMVLVVANANAVELKVDPSVVLAPRAYVDQVRDDFSNGEDVAKGDALIAVRQPFQGAIKRTLDEKNADVVSVRDFLDKATSPVDGATSNQAGIVAAVAYCYATGRTLHWPAGTYVSDANIPNFHDVQHAGNGVIKRGADTFKISQRGGQTNVLYVATTGLSSSDGLSAAQPMSLDQAFAVLPNYGPVLDGNWRVQLAAGTYSGGQYLGRLSSKNRIQFQGPDVGGHPNVPTAIIDGTGSIAQAGWYFQFGIHAQVKDVKFIKWTAGSTAYGLVADQMCNLYTINVHASNNGYAGICVNVMCKLYMQGGIIENNAYHGVRGYGASNMSVGYNGTTTTNRPIIRNNGVVGVCFYHATNGHIDYCDISGNPRNIQLINQSRADIIYTNCSGASIADLELQSYSTWGDGVGNSNTFSSSRPFLYEHSNDIDTVYWDQFDKSTMRRKWGGSTVATPQARFHFEDSVSGAQFNSNSKMILESSASSMMSFGASATGEGGFLFAKPGNTAVGKFHYNYSTDDFRMLVGGASKYAWSSTYYEPWTDNNVTLGTSGFRWSTVYAGTGSINTSDERYKQDIGALSDAVLDAWAEVEFCQFRFIDAVQDKGEEARHHVGVIAQRIKEAFERHGIDPFQYGLLCFDRWDDQWEEWPDEYVTVFDEQGDPVLENGAPKQELVKAAGRELRLAAGERYSIRADECLFLEAALMRRELKRLKAAA